MKHERKPFTCFIGSISEELTLCCRLAAFREVDVFDADPFLEESELMISDTESVEPDEREDCRLRCLRFTLLSSLCLLLETKKSLLVLMPK